MPTTSPRETADAALVRTALAVEYDILGELGRGGMAIVYHARERDLGREVAVKVLPATLAFDPDVVERFQREARIAAQLEHPNIVPIYRVGRAGEVNYFTMKYLRGRPLSSLIEEDGPPGAHRTRRILSEAADALGYAHARGTVHRDVKPDNIILDESGRCIVTDFGIARSAADGRLTATGMSVGTPRYMSPEQARAKGVDGRSDLYALGIVGYECLVGRPPFDEDDALATLLAQCNASLPRPALATAEERELFAVVERLLEKDPARRYQCAADVIGALDDVGARVSAARAADQQRVATVGSAHRARMDASPPAVLDGVLDTALAAAARMVRSQRPKVAAGWRFLAVQGPKAAERARAAADTLRGIAQRSRPVAAAAIAHTRRHARPGIATLIAIVASYVALHFALTHRSRCPPPPAGGDVPLSVLVDPIGRRREGDDLPLYYDVCGLDRGTAFSARVAVTRYESGLRRFFAGGVHPIIASYEETADGPATRRHETLDIGSVPAGAYGMEVVVTDARGRRREKLVDFQIAPR